MQLQLFYCYCFFFLFTYTFCCCCTRCLGTLRLLRSVVRTKAFMPIFSNLFVVVSTFSILHFYLLYNFIAARAASSRACVCVSVRVLLVLHVHHLHHFCLLLLCARWSIVLSIYSNAKSCKIPVSRVFWWRQQRRCWWLNYISRHWNVASWVLATRPPIQRLCSNMPLQCERVEWLFNVTNTNTTAI